VFKIPQLYLFLCIDHLNVKTHSADCTHVCPTPSTEPLILLSGSSPPVRCYTQFGTRRTNTYWFHIGIQCWKESTSMN